MQTKTPIVRMAQLAILIAIVLLMSFTPLGYLKTPGVEISLLTIPVAVGAMLLGPIDGAILGLVFGVTSLLQCVTGLSPFGAALFAINPFFTFLVCVPTRVLTGFLAGYLFQVLYEEDNTKIVSYFVIGLLTALLNTLFFMGALVLFFWNTAFIQSMNTVGKNVPLFVIMFVGAQGLVEMAATCIVGGAVAKGTDAALKRMKL